MLHTGLRNRWCCRQNDVGFFMATGHMLLLWHQFPAGFSMLKDGASRISSVCGLNESPHSAMVLPLYYHWNTFNFIEDYQLWSLLTSSTALSTRKSYLCIHPQFWSVPAHPWGSRSRHNHTRVNEFIANAWIGTNAFSYPVNICPTISQGLAISFMKLILAASMELAAYLVISAEVYPWKSPGDR